LKTEDVDLNSSSYYVGLTGGIASGKSTVTQMFADRGAAIIDTDVVARKVVEPGSKGLASVIAQFGRSILLADGTLDRKQLRALVFADDKKRCALEEILHPLIRDESFRQAAATSSPYVIIVVPLLFKSPMKASLDRILVVDCDETAQLERLLARDADNEAQARRIIASQASRKDRLSIADDVIENSGSLDDTEDAVQTLHRKYLRLAKTQKRRTTKSCRN